MFALTNTTTNKQMKVVGPVRKASRWGNTSEEINAVHLHCSATRFTALECRATCESRVKIRGMGVALSAATRCDRTNTEALHSGFCSPRKDEPGDLFFLLLLLLAVGAAKHVSLGTRRELRSRVGTKSDNKNYNKNKQFTSKFSPGGELSLQLVTD
ncbi:unnamed protein product [Ceratitis capitata]|uniref:(Mediterranean fruit fly) hypothetical protein n=1 Tax=Ceratitis capitata TaxID=7213 RepID=A0A811VER2_CERCA|nr:unnamed protein product [Ceratitis capitata]